MSIGSDMAVPSFPRQGRGQGGRGMPGPARPNRPPVTRATSGVAGSPRSVLATLRRGL
ncbi:hypothetical protein ACVOMT_24380 (plasmid) [Sphingomonas panni]